MKNNHIPAVYLFTLKKPKNKACEKNHRTNQKRKSPQ